MLTGSTMNKTVMSKKTRQEIIKSFQTGPSQIILIDHHFKEGVDLPATHIILFDEPQSRSEMIQIVGRANRYCGLPEALFEPNQGWTIHVHRLGIRFFEGRLRNIDQVELDSLLDDIPTPGMTDAARDEFTEAFKDTLATNVYSPSDVCCLLRGNLHNQRRMRKVADGYYELVNRINIGAILYRPILNLVALQENEFLKLQTEENEIREMTSHYLTRKHSSTLPEARRITRSTNEALRRLQQYITDEDTTVNAMYRILQKLKISYIEKNLFPRVYRELLQDITFLGVTETKAQQLFASSLASYYEHYPSELNIRTWNALFDDMERIKGDDTSNAKVAKFFLMTDEEYIALVKQHNPSLTPEQEKTLHTAEAIQQIPKFQNQWIKPILKRIVSSVKQDIPLSPDSSSASASSGSMSASSGSVSASSASSGTMSKEEKLQLDKRVYDMVERVFTNLDHRSKLFKAYKNKE
jgi:hypothetical protein